MTISMFNLSIVDNYVNISNTELLIEYYGQTWSNLSLNPLSFIEFDNTRPYLITFQYSKIDSLYDSIQNEFLRMVWLLGNST